MLSDNTGSTDNCVLLRLRSFQQPQSAVQRYFVLPAHEDPHDARGGRSAASVFQGEL